MDNDLQEKKPPIPTEKKPKDIEEGELVVVLKHHHITNYNRYVQVCIDKHKEEFKKAGKSQSFEETQDLMLDCATEWNKLSEEERKRYGHSKGTP